MSLIPAPAASFAWSISPKKLDTLGGDVLLQALDRFLKSVGAFDADDAVVGPGGFRRGHCGKRRGGDAGQSQKFGTGQHGFTSGSTCA